MARGGATPPVRSASPSPEFGAASHDARARVERQDIQIDAERLELSFVSFGIGRVSYPETQLSVGDRGDAQVGRVRFECRSQRLVTFVDEIDARVRVKHDPQSMDSLSSNGIKLWRAPDIAATKSSLTLGAFFK